MTVIVQPNVDSNGNPQPMVYDSDTGKVIVDHDGYVLNGGQKLVNVPTLLGYVNTPKTTSDGYGEALQYAINNPSYYEESLGYFLPEVHIKSGYYTITKPIVLNVPYRIMNLTLKGVDSMSPYIGCAFNTTSSDTYPYAININSNDVTNITYINIQWEHFQPQVASGYSPYGFVNFDFSSVNTSQNTFIGYDLDVSNSGFTSAFNLLGFQQIHMYDFENYGSGNNFNAGLITFYGGINYSGNTNVSGGTILSFGRNVTPVDNINYIAIFGTSNITIGRYAPDQTFTIGTLFFGYGAGRGISNHSIFYNPTSGTVTINQLIIRDITASGLPANEALQGSNGVKSVINTWDIEGVYSDNDYVWTNIPYNTPTLSVNPPVSGTVYQNTNPYAIEIDLPVYASTSGTAGYVTVAKGSTDTPTAIASQYVSGDTSSSAVDIVRLRVPAGWYYEFTGSGVTFGTATPFAD